MKSVTYEGFTFKEIEKKIYKIACEIARKVMQEWLEGMDEELAKNRNKAELRHKGIRQTTIKR